MHAWWARLRVSGAGSEVERLEDSDALRPSPSSALYSSLAKDQLDDEEARRVSIEQRAIAVMTLSGALVTILLNTVLNSASAAAITAPAKWLTVTALILLTGAAALALLAARPRGYGQIQDDYLDQILLEYWDEPEIIATRRIGAMQIQTLKFAKTATTRKARILQAAIAVQATGIGFLAGSTGAMLFAS